MSEPISDAELEEERNAKRREWRETSTGTEASLRTLVERINADPDSWEARLIRITETREISAVGGAGEQVEPAREDSP